MRMGLTQDQILRRLRADPTSIPGPRFLWAALVLLLVFLRPCVVNAQVIEGRVVDAESGEGLAADILAVRLPDGDSLRAPSNPAGAFLLRLPEPGRYVISARRFGYALLEAREIQVAAGEHVEVILRLSIAAIGLDPIIVRGHRVDSRHLGSWIGFEARYEERASVGSARLWRRTDPQLRAAIDVRSVLRTTSWREGRSPCLTVFIDGIRRPGWSADLALDLSIEGVHGIEFYTRPLDAPLELRSLGGCPVLAIWR